MFDSAVSTRTTTAQLRATDFHANVREKGLGFGLKDGPAEKR